MIASRSTERRYATLSRAGAILLGAEVANIGRLRNQREIIGYQKALITHFHGAPAFDKWNTSLANVAAQKQASVPPTQFCQQSETLMKQAKALDPNGFKAFAAAQAASAGTRYA